ncbi:MAG: arsenosugar biosynthesis radical SAM (seleno)protein ArsS [Planctomycetota bacterium]
MREDGQSLRRRELTTLQLNVGKMCNLACGHCHVEASPNRREIMTWETMRRILDWVDAHRGDGLADLRLADVTGGAPEMNPNFRRLVAAFRDRGIHTIDRCNLTILLQKGQEGTAEFLAEHAVEVTASLPCYLEDNVDAQRGNGVFRESIEALQRLNALGYGQPGSDLRLDLVYNPVGFGLPGGQASLEAAYKKHLLEHFGIVFHKLWALTNMPVRRFETYLRKEGQYDNYMNRLLAAHHPGNVEGVMCTTLVSVGWRGSVYDCDFNQMLQMPLDGPVGGEHFVEEHSRKVWDYVPAELIDRDIQTAAHCFGCTAGAGSSCTGALN